MAIGKTELGPAGVIAAECPVDRLIVGRKRVHPIPGCVLIGSCVLRRVSIDRKAMYHTFDESMVLPASTSPTQIVLLVPSTMSAIRCAVV